MIRHAVSPVAGLFFLVSLKRGGHPTSLSGMAETSCHEQAELSRGMTQAMDAAHRAKDAYDTALRTKGDYVNAADILADARAIARNAIKAFNDHRKMHGC